MSESLGYLPESLGTLSESLKKLSVSDFGKFQGKRGKGWDFRRKWGKFKKLRNEEIKK